MRKQVADLDRTRKAQVCHVHADLKGFVGRVIERCGADKPLALKQVLGQHICLTVVADYISLLVQRILVKGDKLLVEKKFEGLRLEISHVAADKQRRCHYAPDAEMSAVLLGAHRASHLQHVHVVEMPVKGVCRKVQVLSDNSPDRLPAAGDVAGDPPRRGYVGHPCAGIIPTADIESHVLASGGLDSLMDRSVTGLRVKRQALVVLPGRAAAEVDLDEVEAQLLE